MLTRKTTPTPPPPLAEIFDYKCFTITIQGKLPAPWETCFQRTETIFEHSLSIIITNTIFKLVRNIYKTKVLTKFQEDWEKIVTSIVFTRKTAPPHGGHLHEDRASNETTTVFTSIIRTNGLTKFHEDRTRNVASRVFTRQNVDDGLRTTDKR
ncbi:hypothetical protein DPMN_119249 [Dreissena polymorpha]|uniref:Uncharacterized protein n=1 Tax=Dreissena polymorpha TaxID=45954 RepID=A0A9D4GLK7_DREPO|nr:hypothetical protein DPMN_119249 [Dreissena polymorpha]